MASPRDEGHIEPNLLTVTKLPWLADPILPEDKLRPKDLGEFDDLQLQGIESLTRREYDIHRIPRFKKHSEPTNLEMFYDLWFVANLQIFTAIHTVNDVTNLWSYVGFISLLWFDWFLVSLYDVRYLADSVFERVARVLHMGVMVGFAVICVNYTPEEQKMETFQVGSLVLMVSRVVLAVRYLSILWHVRHFKAGKRAISICVALNLAAALIYMGVTFRFHHSRNSRAYGTWYAVSGVESLAQLGLSLYFEVLSFDGTHLSQRVTLATLFMLAEGINVLGENVVLIVKNKKWTPPSIGSLTAGVALIYFLYMIYFDWVDNHRTLKGIRQVVWTQLHLPFHIVLLLLSEGASQFVQWWKIIESIYDVLGTLGDALAQLRKGFRSLEPDHLSQAVLDTFNNTANQLFQEYELFEEYKPNYGQTKESIDKALTDMFHIPNEFYYEYLSGKAGNMTMDYETSFFHDFFTLFISLSNSICEKYKIDPVEDITKKLGEDAPAPWGKVQDAAIESTLARYQITIAFTFVSAGLTLVLLVLLFSFARPRRAWSWSVAVRMVFFALVGLALALTTLGVRSDKLPDLLTPWLLPTLTLVFFVVVILSHWPRRPLPDSFMFWRRIFPSKNKRRRV